jgi:hypothetical protein
MGLNLYGQAGSFLFACSSLYPRIILRHEDRTEGQAIKPISPVRPSQIALSLSVIPCIMFYINGRPDEGNTFKREPTNS